MIFFLLSSTITTMHANIVEIFPSFQGEGIFVGFRQLFVRFFGCNIQCCYCDTNLPSAPSGFQTQDSHIKNPVTPEQLSEIISRYVSENIHSVSLTGGEPLLHADFIQKMPDVKLPLFLETNGILHDELKKIIHKLSYVSMDYKLPSSGNLKNFSQEHKKFMQILNNSLCSWYVKTVVSNTISHNEFSDAVALIASVSPDIPLIIQPEWNNPPSGNTLDTFFFLASRLNNVRIIPQCHKILSIR